MANKLKDIFSDKMPDLNGNLHFKDNTAYKQFLEALEIVWNEGKPVEVEGVTAIETAFKDIDMIYPFAKHENITNLTIFPSTEDTPLVVDTEYGKKTILFKRYGTSRGMVLETAQTDIVYFKLSFVENSSNITFNYKIQPLLAKTVTEIIESYSAAKALLDTLFKPIGSQESEMISVAKIFFAESMLFFQRVHALEEELNLIFNPTNISDLQSDEQEIEELYLLLVEKKPIRMNRKLGETEATGIKKVSPNLKLEIGSIIAITFVSNTDYILYGEKFSIITANFVTNALIKEIIENEDGSTKILYGDTDSQPMYISYTGFRTEEEAKQELSIIMEHKERYIDAKTLRDHLKETRVTTES